MTLTMYKTDVNTAIENAKKAIEEQIKVNEMDKSVALTCNNRQMYEEAVFTLEKLVEITLTLEELKVK